MKKIVAYLLLLTMSTMLLVGCGGNDTPKKEESSAEETTEKEPEEAEVEKETVKGIGIQTIEGKCDGVDYTVTYDGDVLHLENEEDLSDTNNVRFTSLEDKLKIRVRTDEKNFLPDIILCLSMMNIITQSCIMILQQKNRLQNLKNLQQPRHWKSLAKACCREMRMAL